MRYYRFPFTRNDGQQDSFVINERSLIELAMQRGGKWMDRAIEVGLMQVSTY